MTAIYSRPFWTNTIERAWKRRPLVWLSGARRSGKTTIAKMFGEALYLNCDLPSTHMRLEDPEYFYREVKPGSIIIFDEIHRLQDPSTVLKIGCDEYPGLRLLATGSSSLAATSKFKDSLTGRKVNVYLPPILITETGTALPDVSFDKRLISGGMPEQLLQDEHDHLFFSEWMDSYYARDIQELFNIRNRQGFLSLLKLLFRNSGGLINHTHLSKQAGISRPTAQSYIEAMQIAQTIHLLYPYAGGGKREITSMPKGYAFDTGFVCFQKGWTSIRSEDRGILWEHLVLDLLLATQNEGVFYWKDKSGREIDFILPVAGGKVNTIECKIDPARNDTRALSAFRESYPKGRNFVLAPGIMQGFSQEREGMHIAFIGPNETHRIID